jgi:exopolysaccharide biosynthesis polyprenyl glycosylphosphotransferase
MKRFELFLNVIQLPVDFLLLLAAAGSAYALRFAPFFVSLRPVMFGVTISEFLRIAAVIAIGWLVLFAILGLYATDPNRRFFGDVVNVFFACSAGLAGVALYVLFTQQVFDSRFLAAVSWAIAVAYVTLGRLLMRLLKTFLYRVGIGNRRVAIVGRAPAALTIASFLRENAGLGYTLIGAYPSFDDLLRTDANNIDELMYAGPTREGGDALRAIEWCIERQMTFKYSADVFATYATNMNVQPIAGIPVIEIRRTRLDGWWRIVKRTADVLGSIVILLLASPVVIAAALAILLETGRPILYKNERVGFRGKKFFTLKFRSMRQLDCTGPQFGASGAAAEEREAALIKIQNAREGPIYKIADDPRVTPVGRFLRRWSIDELPQFFNVLNGEMSIVGPRPHQPREVAEYKTEHKRVFFVKPGMTGLAQLSGRSDLSSEEELPLDVFYLEQWRLRLDVIILLKTPFILFRKRKAL